jgi:hypothetical protein
MAAGMAPELSLPSHGDAMDVKDIMSKGQQPHPRFRPRPTYSNTKSSSNNNVSSSSARLRHHSEKQHLSRQHRQRPTSAVPSSPPKKFSSTKPTRKKALSTMDARSVVSVEDRTGTSSSNNNSGNLSYTDILGQKSFRDVVGGDLHANQVLASHERKVECFMKEQRVKEGRRNNVKNSLATFLQANTPEDDSITVEDGHDDDDEEIMEEADDIHEAEDDHWISDTEQEENERNLRDATSDGAAKQATSVKRIDSLGSKSSRRVTRTTRTLDQEESGGVGGGGSSSNHSRKSMARPVRKGSQRVRSKASGEDDDGTKTRSHSASRMSSRRVQRVRKNIADPPGDEASVVDASSRRSRRGASRVRNAAAEDADDSSVTSSQRNRTATRPRSVDASIRRQRSQSRCRDQQRVPQRMRSQSRSRGDDDDRSVASKVSNVTSSRRGRRPGKGPQAKKNLLPPSQANGKEKTTESPPSSPENNKDFLSRSMPSLANHFDSQREEERRVDADVASEASSSHFSSATPQSTLLQFDPTSKDLIQAVNQKGAKRTSETFKHADGTESKFQISELAGLPTFEKPKTADEMLALNSSSQSLDVSFVKSDDEEEDKQTMKINTRPNLRTATFGKSFGNIQIQNPGEPPVEPVRRAPRVTKSSSALTGSGSGPPNKRGVMQPTKSLSFMQRVQNRKAQFTESMMNRSTRVLGLDHQALLEDEGSEHD